MRVLLLVIHIAAVGTWLGANVAQVASTGRLTAGGGKIAAAWMDTTVLWGRILYMPASIIILATGIGLVLDNDSYEFSQAFVSIGFAAVIIAAVTGMVVFAKGGEQASTGFNSGDDAAGHAAVKRMMPWGIIDSAVLLFAIYAMVGKWGV